MRAGRPTGMLRDLAPAGSQPERGASVTLIRLILRPSTVAQGRSGSALSLSK